MTEFELTFSYKIEEMLSRIAHPEYRQLLVEAIFGICVAVISSSLKAIASKSNLSRVFYSFNLLSVIATILERNPEITFGSGPIDCDVRKYVEETFVAPILYSFLALNLIKKAFYIYADQEKISDKEDLTPFYQLENISMQTSTATYLAKISSNLDICFDSLKSLKASSQG
ncbi:unnamed protein product [Cylicostephanus goldi]|uniref:Uncharacterized protein n=1 Tax=Cylicostephanus goldi TaxID=71465 RepID=A0A3P6RBG9_CYLGO|nr:unnamed protein product [Cylicostephanus goldi]